MKEDIALIDLASDKRAEFLMLFEEFVRSYLLSPTGEKHSAYYDEGRRQARSNLARLIESKERDEDRFLAILSGYGVKFNNINL